MVVGCGVEVVGCCLRQFALCKVARGFAKRMATRFHRQSNPHLAPLSLSCLQLRPQIRDRRLQLRQLLALSGGELVVLYRVVGGRGVVECRGVVGEEEEEEEEELRDWISFTTAQHSTAPTCASMSVLSSSRAAVSLRSRSASDS